MAQVDPAVASAAAANDGTAELAAATAAVLPRDLPQRPCAVIDELLSVIGAEPLLRSLNHAGRAGVARWSQTRVEAARSVLLDQLGLDGARVERASRNLESAARAALEGGGGVGIKNARFKMLVRMVPRSEQQRLDLGRRNIGDAGAQALAPELRHTAITTLILHTNQIGDAGAQALAPELRETAITHLRLHYNNIGVAGARALAQELPHTAITDLRLGNNHIGDAGAKALAPELPHTAITALGLAGNQIGDAGAQALAPELPHTAITTLWLNSNRIGDAGAQALVPELPHTAITTLYLVFNPIGPAAAQAIRAALPNAPDVYF